MARNLYLQSQVVQGRYMYLNCTQTPIVADNASEVAWTLTVTGGESSYYTTGPTQVTIGGKVVYDRARAQWYDRVFPAARGSVSGKVTIEHGETGDSVIPVSIHTMIYDGVAKTSTATWTMDKIDRYASIVAVPDFTDEADPAVTYRNYAGELVTSLKGCISLDGETALFPYEDFAIDGTEHTFALTQAQREQLLLATPDSNTMDVYFLLETEIGGNTGVATAVATMSVANPSPTVAPEVIDVNEVTVGVTGDAAALVAGHSVASVTINPVAKKFSQIVSQRVEHGTTVLEGDGVLTPVSVAPIRIVVTDSRGNETVWEAPNTIIPYFAPGGYIENTMPDGEGTMPLVVQGSWFGEDLGNTPNVLLVEYRYKAGGGEYVDWIPTDSVRTNGNSFTAETVVTDLEYTSAYTFQARISDLIDTGGVLSAEITVKAIPTFHWSKEDFQFEVPVKAPSLEAERVTGLSAPEEETDATNKSYVDGQIAEVLALALAEQKLSMTLLWENASPTSAFAAQTIALDLSEYSFVLVATTSWAPVFRLAMVGKWAEIQDILDINASYSGYIYGCKRGFNVLTTGITFEAAYYKAANSTTSKLVNDRHIPYKIYGIKGVTA